MEHIIEWDKVKTDFGWYDSVVDMLGGEMIASERVGDYQGDVLIALKHNGEYGYIVCGYGSCSHCDALEGCDNDDERKELFDSLVRGADWFDTLDGLKAHVASLDGTSWEYNEPEFAKFRDAVSDYVG